MREGKYHCVCVCVCVCVSTPHTYLPRKPSWRSRELELDIALERTHISLSLRLVLSWFVLFSAIQGKIFISQNTLFSSKNSIVSQINFWVWCELEARILFFPNALRIRKNPLLAIIKILSPNAAYSLFFFHGFSISSMSSVKFMSLQPI